MHHPRKDSTDEAAAASAVCAAKSASWEALRRLHSGQVSRTEAYALMQETSAAAEEFRATYHPDASRAFGTGDRGLGQSFQMWVVYPDGPRQVWSDEKAVA